MSSYPPPELLSRKEREDMADDLGLPRDYFEDDLDMNRIVTYEGRKITMAEWKQIRGGSKAD